MDPNFFKNFISLNSKLDNKVESKHSKQKITSALLREKQATNDYFCLNKSRNHALK